MDKFKDKIKTLRQERKITQQQLADGLKVSKQAVSKWEKGYSLPDVTSIEIIAEYFGVSTDYLLNDDAEICINKKDAAHFKAIAAKEKIILRVAVCVLFAVIVALSVCLGISVNSNRIPETVKVNGWEIKLSEYDNRLHSNTSSFKFYVYNSTDYDKYMESGCISCINEDGVKIFTLDNLPYNLRQTIEPKNGFLLSVTPYSGSIGKYTLYFYGTPILKFAVADYDYTVKIIR